MNNTKEKTNADATNTTINNTVLNKNIFSYMSQKQITDKSSGKTTEFVVMSDSKCKNNDWISKTKFMDIAPQLGDKPVEYPLKKTLQGNPDEGKTGQEGKALRLMREDKNVIVEIYTQTFGQTWALSHTHIIEKTVFDAYALVVKNNEMVKEAEEQHKSPDNFSLNLG